MNIYLIGSMGVGKSSMGRMIAKNLDIAFVDTDEEIVDNECKSVNAIFADEGEVYFRQQEANVIRSFDVTKKRIVATGGGLPMYHANMDYMLKDGLVVYLDIDLDVLIERLHKGKDKRPAIKSLDINEIRNKLTSMLEKRSSVYEQAHIKYHRLGNIKKEADELSKYINIFI